jgi:dual oxidase
MINQSHNRDRDHLHELTYLTKEEINSFLDQLDHNKDGQISYTEFETALDKAHEELVPKPLPHHLTHPSRDDSERHEFLQTLLGCTNSTENTTISREKFGDTLRSLNIPSLEQEQADEKADKEYMKSLPFWRRIRSYYSVNGPKIVFMTLVVSMQLAFGIWQLVTYLKTTSPPYRSTFGWGLVLAKTCAGILYPTLFFLILSMSRWWLTLSRSFSPSIINLDLSQSFHIKISILALGLGTLHAIGHLTGSFVFGSKGSKQQGVEEILGGESERGYVDYVRTTAGWSGLVALGLFWILALFSMPRVRRWNYEVFQLIHLLMVR